MGNRRVALSTIDMNVAEKSMKTEADLEASLRVRIIYGSRETPFAIIKANFDHASNCL